MCSRVWIFFPLAVYMWCFFIFLFTPPLSKIKHVLLLRLLILIEILTCYNELNNIVPSHKENKHLCVSLEPIHFWKSDANQGLSLLIFPHQNFCSTCPARFTAKLFHRSHKWNEGQGAKLLTLLSGYAPVSWESWFLVQPWRPYIKEERSPLWISKGGIRGRAGLRLYRHQD